MEISNSTVLLTGGTGQIGCSLAEKLLEENVRKVILFDNLLLGTQKNAGEISKNLKVELL